MGVLIVITLVVAEFGLRLLGYEYTSRPDKLVLDDSFKVNERGLFVANPLSKKHAGLSVNRDGFRSPDFSDDATPVQHMPTVVILGDSFAWGATANPISESFTDVLRRAGYRVHNLGIPGIGPRQYRRMAEVYLPRLKPDVVVVALYLGNDFLDGQWEPPPGLPPYYVLKGAGWITPFDEDGNYIESVDAAYEHFHNKFGKIRRFLRETAIGTVVIKVYRGVMAWTYAHREGSRGDNLAWAASESSGELPNESSGDAKGLLQRYSSTYEALGEIRALAIKIGAQYHTLVIPALGSGCLTSADFSLGVQRKMLKEFRPVYLDVSNHHYTGVPDCHFNNSGHLVAAHALEKILRISAESTAGTER
jgi:hypothetical protein